MKKYIVSVGALLLQFIFACVASAENMDDIARKSVGFERQNGEFWEYFKDFKYRGKGTVEGSVLLQSETPPKLPGGVGDFFRKNFRYTKDTWKAERKRAITVDCVIRKDGTVTGIECPKISDPDLIGEIERVVSLMKWKPATVGGKPVNVYKSFYVDLHPGKASVPGIPYGLEEIVKRGKHSSDILKKMSVAEASPAFIEYVSDLKECAQLFPDNADMSLRCARLLSSIRNGKEAITLTDSCLRFYNPFRYVKNDPTLRPPRRDYSGKTEIGIALTGLILRCNHAADSKDAFEDVCDLISRRVIDGDLNDCMTDISASTERIKQLERDMVTEFSKGAAQIDRSTPVWEKITREYSIDELSRGLAYWSERGMIDNAAVGQLSALIDSEYDLMRKGKGVTGKDHLNLFGIKALAVWLQDGEGGMRNFITDLKGGDASKQLVKYLDKLEKRYDENAPAMADRKGVIEALACLVPPQGADEAACKAFYEHRRAAEKVFPIKWLAGN